MRFDGPYLFTDLGGRPYSLSLVVDHGRGLAHIGLRLPAGLSWRRRLPLAFSYLLHGHGPKGLNLWTLSEYDRRRLGRLLGDEGPTGPQ